VLRFFEQSHRATISGVNVQPDAMITAHIGNLGDGVNAGGRSCSDSGDNGERAAILTQVSFNGVSKSLNVHFVFIVCRNAPHV
jgi:hypothetical protein